MSELSNAQKKYFQNSKARDEEGKLLKVYAAVKDTPDVMLYQSTTYTDPRYLKEQPGFSIVCMYVNAENPYCYNDLKDLYNIVKENGYETIGQVVEHLKSQGYDSIIGENSEGVKEVTVFQPNQLKATVNRFPTKDDYSMDNSEDYRRQNFRNLTLPEHFELAKYIKEKNTRSQNDGKEIGRNAHKRSERE